MMCALLGFRLHNPHIIDLVDPHFSARMNDLVRVQQEAYVCDLPLFVVEECEIAGTGLLEESNGLPLGGLLIGVPHYRNTQELIYRLHITAAVQSKNRFPTPEIRNV